ncbi:MAG: hypothetical protein ACD_63C00091G0005 [uncultured bacterium]|nr:MAG: hypothetical protein ACD_63C00091G0005 [uncultured bacterium]
MKTKIYKPVVLIILDGWGINPSIEGNAIALAKTPIINSLEKYFPATSLSAAGISVGLFWGENGNSEVGHLNIGSGMIIYQNLPRITLAIQNGSFFKNKNFKGVFEHVKKNNSRLHFIGLVSAGGIHSHIDHLFALLDMAKENKVKEIYIHAITDGRDTPRNTAKRYINDLEKKLKKIHLGKIATVSGRFYAMDRDNRWDRIEATYKAMVKGIGKNAESAKEAIKTSYENQEFDENIKPTVILKGNQPTAKIEDKDGVIFFNFRVDRAREITKAFVLPGFNKFSRDKRLDDLYFVTMAEYEENLPVHAAFITQKIEEPLAKVISENGKKQLHIAETEKYAHVTYFLDGGMEKPYPGEDQLVVQSPRVKSYDKVPEMSAEEITNNLIKKIYTAKYDFIVVNFANPDMIAHTGNIKAAVRAIEFLDKKIGEITEATLSIDGTVMITADHGNIEQMIDPSTKEIIREHTTNPVPFILVANDLKKTPKTKEQILQDKYNPIGVLADIAPTVLDLMGLPKPKQMTGISLRETLVGK